MNLKALSSRKDLEGRLSALTGWVERGRRKERETNTQRGTVTTTIITILEVGMGAKQDGVNILGYNPQKLLG